MNKEDLLGYKNTLIIGADKSKGEPFFHLEWEQDEYDLLRIIDYIRLQIIERMGSE